MVVMGLMATGGNVVQAPLYTEIFPTEVRMTGYAVSTQLGNIIVRIYPDDCCNVGASGLSAVPVLIFTTIMMGMGVIRLPIDEGDDGRRHRRGVAGGIPA